MTWTEDQVLAAVTDAATFKHSLELVNPIKWSNTGSSARSLWGECAGSGKLPYQVNVYLAGPAFKCSCPSWVFPCKLGAGLMLLWGRSRLVQHGDPQAWGARGHTHAESSADLPSAYSEGLNHQRVRLIRE